MARVGHRTIGMATAIGGLFTLRACAIPEYSADQAPGAAGNTSSQGGVTAAQSPSGGVAEIRPGGAAGLRHTAGAAGITSSVLGDAAGAAGVPAGGVGGAHGGRVADRAGGSGMAGGAGLTGSTAGGSAGSTAGGSAGSTTGGVAGSAGEAHAGQAGEAAGTSGGGAGGGARATAGAGGVCGTRDCTSARDNDCNGQVDQKETQWCQCPTPGKTEACNTELLGICRPGTRICSFAADNSSSAWSACVGLSAGARDCRSAADNNCDGTVDQGEAPCSCGPGVALGGTRECGTPERSGVGACHPGSQTCVESADHTSRSWTTCNGAVAPTTPESCGPNVTDVNCNGVVGDGTDASCQKTIYLYEHQETSTVCTGSCGTSCSAVTTIVGYRAAESSPGSGWIAISSFRVFDPQPSGDPAQLPAVRNCSYGGTEFVKVGGDCTTISGGSGTVAGIVGYVSTVQAGGYVPLSQREFQRTTTTSSGCSSITTTTRYANIPLAGDFAGASASPYYVLPNDIPR